MSDEKKRTCDWGSKDDLCGPVVTNLDGDDLCQKHADAWVKAEGEAARDAERRGA